MKVFIINQLNQPVQLSVGKDDYILNPDQETEINLKEGDCLYLDPLGDAVNAQIKMVVEVAKQIKNSGGTATAATMQELEESVDSLGGVQI